MRLKRGARVVSDVISQFAAPEGDDCLNLNIWTPTLDPDARLPVAVWIHGGSFTSGAGSQPCYDGSALAARGMVVVTINYRLGLWGFMGGDDLFAGDIGVANRGFLDQLQALRWVHENIGAFGGDRDCVTVMGESAGATSTIAMAMSPLTNGLMRRAISFSGAAISVFPHDEYSRFARDFFESLGVKPGDADALTALSIDAVARASPSSFLGKHRARYGALGREHFSHFGMATGTELFPQAPEDFIRAGNKPGLDVMLGTCRDEARLWTIFLPLPDRYAARMAFRVHGGILNPRDEPKQAFANYKAMMPGASDIPIHERAMTDALFRKWTSSFADVHSAVSPGRTFLYRYDWQSPTFGGAIHCIDIPGVFQTYESMLPLLGSVAAARPAGDALHRAVVQFIKTGKPEAGWAPYDAATKACMVFDTQSELRHDIDADFATIW